jgi:ABC-2 type transport system permease protein
MNVRMDGPRTPATEATPASDGPLVDACTREADADVTRAAPYATRTREARADLRDGWRARELWWRLAWQEIRHRYRRSLLGPFWLTISAGLGVVVMGPLYGTLLGVETGTYLPHLAVGLVVWQLVAGMATEGCQAFIAAEGFIRNAPLPLTTHVWRVVCRNAVIFAHSAVLLVVVFAIYPQPWSASVLTVPLALGVVLVAGFAFTLLAGLASARFRDLPQIVTSLVQVLFFVTPVLWSADMLGDRARHAAWNPLLHYLEIVRAPLLGRAAPPWSWAIALVLTAFVTALAFAAFARWRRRIAFWV